MKSLETNFEPASQEIVHLEKKEMAPMSVDELSSRLRDSFKNERQSFHEDRRGKERMFFIIKTREEFVKNLLFEEERFNRIFKTSSGSIYFQFEKGGFFRAKMIPDKREFEESGEESGKHFQFQPIMGDVFFLDQEESNRLEGIEIRPGQKIKVTKFGLGASPFELNVNGKPPISFEENEGEITLIGTKRTTRGVEEIDTSGLYGGIHKGHPIVEIIK